ncbi:DUF2946 family protein [Methylocystis heyeri]|uniref:DUF2946 domain-containing protein n=1 Tax=Methylocystis heyeri TaxID=391905 RepID=A0A6B8K8K4_9HYPH|nr:DUF2946 family protein [Methylocystis heyeri]QGM44346.1 hypothetical protein H2LOC_000760 [Methylocystis heyeri]
MISHRATNASGKWIVVTVVTACFFVWQALLAGAMPGGMSYAGDAICAQQSDIGSKDTPPAPGAHHHAACCLLHPGVLLLPAPRPASAVKAERIGELLPLATDRSARLSGGAPELGPLSARAPPRFFS